MYSLRSREEERISKPGAVSTPVKHADDHTPKTVEEVVVERNEKQAPNLPGKPHLWNMKCRKHSVKTKLFYNLQNYIYRRYKDAVTTTATIAVTYYLCR